MGNLRRILLLLLSFSCLASMAEQRLNFSWGHQTTRCTYLSPLTYTGPGYGLTYEWRKTAWRGETIGMRAIADLDYGYLLSPAKNSRMLTLEFNLAWGVERLWMTDAGFSFAFGATAGVDGGVLYLPRNGNNPAQALMWAGASLSGRMGYDRLRLFHKPLSLSISADVPSLGAFFCPQYGETYYEIYVGNHSGLTHFGWWGNRPQVNSRILADWKLGRNALTLGLGYNFQGLECNGITTRVARCSGLIGVYF